MINYEKNIKDCYNKKDEIVSELTEFFTNKVKIWSQNNEKYQADKSGKTKFSAVNFDFDKERKVDYAIVTFDNEVLSRKEVVAAIQSVSEGAYQVKKVTKAHCGENFCNHSDSKEKI